MKKRLLTYALLLLAGIGIAYGQNNFDFSAVSSSGHTLFYHINPDDTTVTVVSPSGWSWAESWEWEDYLPWGSLTIPSTVSYGGSTYGVTAIGSNAFADCYDLTSVTIPNSITSIGSYAFSYCNILSLAIPNSVISIGSEAFYLVFNIEYHGTATGSPWGATHLNAFFDDGFVFTDSTMTELISYTGEISDIEIPNTVTTIGNEAFSSPNVTSITSVTIPNSVNQIGDYAFYGSPYLFSVTIQNAATSIGEYAFASCTQLESLALGDSVTAIGDNAFEHCSALTSVAIPNSVSTIGSFAFYNCYNMSSLTIGNSANTIGDYAFSRCRTLAPVVIPPTITTIGEYAFSNVPFILYCGLATGYPWGAQRCICGYVDGDFVFTDSSQTVLKAYIGNSSNVSIPSSVTSIGDSAFYNCTNIFAVEIPNSVTSIGNSAFSNCRRLDSVSMSNNLSTIGEYAFWECYSLSAINIPVSVDSIGRVAFAYCYNLPSITIPPSVSFIGDNAFISDSLIIYLGQLTGGPWGAERAILYAEGDFLYADSTKSELGLYTGHSSSVVIPNSVTSIWRRAFYENDSLRIVIISDSVTTIEEYSFYNCPNLTKVTFGSSVTNIYQYAFANCSLIDTIVFRSPTPPSLNNANVFYNVPNISTVIVPCHSWFYYQYFNFGYNTTIQESEGCMEYDFWAVSPSNDTLYYRIMDSTSVRVVHPRSDLRWEGVSWPVGQLIIPASVVHEGIEYRITSIAELLFLNDTALTSLSLPYTIDSIGNYAFAYCTQIDTLIYDIDSCIGLNPYYEGAYNSRVFYGDNNISTIILGNHVKVIPEASFYYYTNNISSLHLGDSVTHIGNNAFYGLRNIDTLIIPNSVTSIGSRAFIGSEQSLYDGNVSNLKTVIIGSSVNTIGELAFALHTELDSISVVAGNTTFDSRNGCNAIIETTTNTLIAGCQSTMIPNSITAIGEGAFAAIRHLRTITLPDSLQTIGGSAFVLCDSLSSISFPTALTYFGEYSFNGCYALDSIFLASTVPPTLGYGAFSGVASSIPVVVPCYTYSTYTESSWHNYFSNIIEPTDCPILTYFDFWDISSSNDTLYYKILDSNNVACVHPLMFDYNAEHSYWMGYTQPSESLVIPDSVTNGNVTYHVASIWDNTFKGNTNITSVTIPEGIDSLGDYAFANCSNLDTMYYNVDSNAYWTGQSLTWTSYEGETYDYYISYAGTTIFENDNISTLYIGNNVRHIPELLFNAPGFDNLETLFFNADSLLPNPNNDYFYHGHFKNLPITALHIGENVKHIPNKAFMDCHYLTRIVIPNSVTRIGTYAFYNNREVNLLKIGCSVSSIGYAAFDRCINLDTIILFPSTPPVFESYSFNQVPSYIPVIVPCNTITSYITSAWNSFSNIIELCIDRSDLTVTNLTIPDVVSSCTDFSISATITNIGRSQTHSNGWSDVLFISRFDTLDSSAIELARIRHNVSDSYPLLPDSSYTVIFSVNIPRLWTGNSYLFVLTDIENSEDEDSTLNNIGQSNPILIHPLSNVTGLYSEQYSVFTHGPVVLRWDTVNGAINYGIYIWRAGDNMPTYPTYTTRGTSQQIFYYENRQTYNWKVEAYNLCDTSESIIQHFIIYNEPYLSIDIDTLNFEQVTINENSRYSFFIDCRDLTDSIHISIHGADSAFFSLSSNRISYLGGTVDVDFFPTLIQHTYNAYIIVSSGIVSDTLVLSASLANYYIFTVNVSDSILPANTPVNISGTLENAAGQAQANVAVDVYVKIMGQTYLYTDTTDALGRFGATYTPVPSECGYYEVGACLHGSNSRLTMTEFNIPGISILADAIQWTIAQNDTIRGDIPVRNRSNVTLHNITVTANSLPSGVNIQFDPLTLSPLGNGNLHYTLIGGLATIGNDYENAQFTATCTEGELGNLSAYYYCYLPMPDLLISFDTIVCAAVPGTQKVVDVVLYNNTNSTFNNVSIQIPAGFAGMQLLHEDSTFTIAPHDTLYVPLLVMFPEGTPLAPVTGSIAVTADGTASQLVPFVINVVSTAKGSLRVLVSNEYTYAYGTHVSDAHVVVVGYYSLDTVAAATTDSTGMLIFDSLPEGYYNLYVEAPDNNSYVGVVQVRGSHQTFKEVHLEYQAVTYTLEVNQTSVDDKYNIELVTHYKTNVPKPVVILDVPRFSVPYDGSFGTFNIVASNHGLIDCYDAVLTVPSSEFYDFVPLYDRIDTLKALTSIIIPCAVRNKRIYDTIVRLSEEPSYVVDTIYKVRTHTETRTRYRDTTIYVPVSYIVNEITQETIWVRETIVVHNPHYVIDTIYDSIVDRIYWYDTIFNDTVFTISASLEPLWGNCETHPFKLMAHWTCSEGNKWVFAGTTVEKMDCSHPGDGIDPILNGLSIHFSPSHGSWGGGTRTTYPPRFNTTPPNSLPHINWPKLPKNETDWECQPCWYKATVTALDCSSHLYNTNNSTGSEGSAQNNADNYRDQSNQWKSAVDGGDPATIARTANQLSQTPIRLLNQAAYYGQQSTDNGNTSSTGDSDDGSSSVFNTTYGESALTALTQLLGEGNPYAEPLAFCVDDLFGALSECPNDSVEIPWGYNVNFSSDTNVNVYNIRLAKTYYDTLKVIRYKLVDDSMVVFREHPEVLYSITRRLVTTVIPTVQQLKESYDTTIIEIDTVILKRYINRWCLTKMYYERGWLNPSMVPTGYSLDFFYLDTNTTGALERMELTAMDEGYWSIEELYMSTLDSMVSYPKKKSVCAGATLQFNLSIAMTREAFEGRLVINNPHDSVALRDLSLLFGVSDTLGHDCSNMFDIQIIGRHNVDSLGTLAPNSTGTITVRYVPLMSAAPMAPVPYLFGGSIAYTDPFTAAQMSDELKPVKLTVHPSPHLQIDYFVTHNIIADDPLTIPVIEPSIPATIGLRVLNKGAGSAENVRISSLSPQVVDNRQGLVVDLAMLNSMMDGAFCSKPLSDIVLGTVLPDETHTLEYLLKSSLLGTITVDNINVIHNSSINDRDMSLVSARAHSLVKTVMEYRPGSDTIHDFLTNDGGLNRPDTIYFSSGRSARVIGADSALFDHYIENMDTVTLPDSTVEVVRVVDTVVRVTLFPDTIGWQYASTYDPGQGKYDIVSCMRDDSVSIPLDNIWLTFVDLVAGLDPEYNNRLHIVDTLTVVRSTSYNVTFRLKEDMLKVEEILDIPIHAIGSTLDSFRVRFNQPVIDTSFTYADMSLKCNNGVELMDSTVTVSRVDDTTYSVHIANKTNAFGLYVLKVMADNIRNANGHFGAGGREEHWVHSNCNTVKDSIAVTACDRYMWRDTLLTLSGIYTDTLSQIADCDSILLLNLTIHNSDNIILVDTACDSYTWRDSIYTASSIDSITSINSQGCDSTVTLHLTINYSTASTDTVTACDSYTWHDSIYTASSIDSITSINSLGCDSTVTLLLTINYSTTSTETVTACDSYTWHDSIYTASSIDSITSINSLGCDSTVTLLLTINYSTHDTIVDSAAGSYTWQGNTYTESGEYLFEGQTEAGCDSIIVLQLTITKVGICTADNLGHITLSPNPTTGRITITPSEVDKVEVYDQSGRIVATFHDSNVINIQHLPTGLYTLRVTLHNGNAIKRVIKQ